MLSKTFVAASEEFCAPPRASSSQFRSARTMKNRFGGKQMLAHDPPPLRSRHINRSLRLPATPRLHLKTSRSRPLAHGSLMSATRRPSSPADPRIRPSRYRLSRFRERQFSSRKTWSAVEKQRKANTREASLGESKITVILKGDFVTVRKTHADGPNHTTT